MKAFKVKGTFAMGESIKPFAKEVAAESKEQASEYIYSDLGSKHRTERRYITIENVEEISNPEEISSVYVRQVVESK